MSGFLSMIAVIFVTTPLVVFILDFWIFMFFKRSLIFNSVRTKRRDDGGLEDDKKDEKEI